MTHEITTEQTKAFWKYITKKYKTHVKNKSDSDEIKLIASLLSIAGIMDADKFLNNYTQTLGSNIYPNFTVGDPGKVPLDLQAAVCIHEHVHVRQFRSADFVWGYCINSAKRTLYECEAYRANMEIGFWFTGKCQTPSSIVKAMKGYNLTNDDLKFAQEYLTKSAAIIKQGAVMTPESQVAIAWLKRYL